MQTKRGRANTGVHPKPLNGRALDSLPFQVKHFGIYVAELPFANGYRSWWCFTRAVRDGSLEE